MDEGTKVELTQEQLDTINKQITDLNTKVELLEEGNTALNKSVNGLTEQNKKLAAEMKKKGAAAPAAAPAADEPKKKEKPKVPAKDFEVDGKKYRFTVPQFRWNKQVVTSEAALEDESLLAEIVNQKGSLAETIGSGIIQLIVE